MITQPILYNGVKFFVESDNGKFIRATLAGKPKTAIKAGTVTESKVKAAWQLVQPS